LAESGQQTPIVVVAAEGQTDRYVVIDGYKRRRWNNWGGTR
jgi:ParB-like chromosome segregation protein Spo0J